MKIALLGPVGERTSRLETAAAVCFTRLSCDAAFYLGDEPEVLEFLAQKRRSYDTEGLDELLHDCEACLEADAAEVLRRVTNQRAKQALLQIELLEDGLRQLRPPSGARWLLCSSTDALPDHVRQWPEVVGYGSDERWAADERDGRLVLCPGRVPEFGLMVIDDSSGANYGALSIQVYDEGDHRVAHVDWTLKPAAAAPDAAAIADATDPAATDPAATDPAAVNPSAANPSTRAPDS